MTRFQGASPAGISSLMERVLAQAGVAHQRSDRYTSAVADLSRLFTKQRAALDCLYLDDPDHASAYVSYFLPVNLVKIQVLLDELPSDTVTTESSYRVLDLGAGPGTGGLAVLDWFYQHHPGSTGVLSVTAIDASAEALRQAERLWETYNRTAGISGAKFRSYKANLERTLKVPQCEEIKRIGSYDLIILANCLNELFVNSHNPVSARADLVADVLPLLAPHGTMMIVEPALRETSRRLHEVRDLLLRAESCTLYSPCLHERRCPALINPNDWCHEERSWEAPPVIQEIDRKVGFIKDALKFSYLLLRTDGRTIANRSLNTFRMVSELRQLKGDTRAWLCNELGRFEVGRLDRAKSEANSAWDECQRGTIIQIEGITHKERASLGRIPDDATVDIVRSI
jgi:ribosomal protein RSM22 (predicted rRNA methylase)